MILQVLCFMEEASPEELFLLVYKKKAQISPKEEIRDDETVNCGLEDFFILDFRELDTRYNNWVEFKNLGEEEDI